MSVANTPAEILPDHWAKDLNYQQEQFVLEYEALGFKNAAQAARSAGYGSPENQGPRLLTRAHVIQAVRHRKEEFYRANQMHRDQILWELANIAGFDFGSIMRLDSSGRPHLDLSGAGEAQTRVLREIETTTEQLYEGKGADRKATGEVTKVKVKTHDKLTALKLLMQHLGMIQEGNVNVAVAVDFGERMMARRSRVIDQEP